MELRLRDQDVAEFVQSATAGRRILAFGVGDGEHVRALLRGQSDVTLTVWDRDPWLLRLFLDAQPLGEEFVSGRLSLALTTDIIELACDPDITAWAHPVACVQYAHEWEIMKARGLGSHAPLAMVAEGELFVDDLADALSAEGYRVFPLDAALHAVEELALQVTHAQAALVASINYKEGLAEFCAAHGLPLISWEIDPTTDRMAPLEAPDHQARLFTYRRAQVAEFQAAGFSHVEYLPLASNPGRRLPSSPNSDDAARYGVPVAFVGASLQDQVATHRAALLRIVEQTAERRDDAVGLERRLSAVLDAQARDYSRYLIPELFEAHWGDLKISAGGSGENAVQLVGEIAAANKRTAYLAALGSRGVHVWGDDGFADLAGTGAVWRGLAGHYHELNKIYSYARINVDIGRLYQQDIVTMRVFDVLACGGFVIAEWSEALAELFDVGREVEAYRTLEELVAKIDHYSAHRNETGEIAERGRYRVLRDHTIRARVRRMLDSLEA